MPRRMFTDEQEREIAAAYLGGDPTQAIATTWNCTPETVANIVRRQGGTVRPPRFYHSSQRISLPEDELMERWEAGESATELAAAYGVNPWTIRARLRERGLATERRQRGPRHSKWRGGRITMKSGYTRVWVGADDPLASMRNSDGYVLEHRLVMAQSLGRPLTTHESVHHLDGDRSNNTVENLQLRQRHHGEGRRYVCLDCGSHNIGSSEL